MFALGHGFQASVAHPHAPRGTCSTHEQIALCFAVDRAGAQGPQALVDVGKPGFFLKPTPTIDAAETLAHAEFNRRAALIADTRETLGIRELEARERELSDATNDALREALSTKPSTPAGLVELMKVFAWQASIFRIDSALEAGPETMLAALRDLFPEIQEARS